jgi:murein DD-endopeptidase MepM/ murein hydrolase activator NlpD
MVLSLLPLEVGGSIADLQQKQQQIENKIAEYRKQADALKKEKNNVQSELNALDYEINALNLEVDSYELQKKEKEIQIAESEQKIASLTQEIEDSNKALEERLRVSYKKGTAGYIEVVLKSENLIDAITRLDMIQKIVESDIELLKGIEQQKKDLEQANVTLEAEKSELLVVIGDLSAKQDQVLVAARSKESYMAGLQKNIKELQRQEAAMEAQSKELERQILAAQRAVEYAGGEMLWPVPGYYRITSNFGGRSDPITGVWTNHGGTDMAAPNGTPIVAANSGVVLMAGWNNSYGNYVIIDHGGGISTLYGHSSKLLVSAGQAVSRGDKIALVGSTGYSTGNHLHFEVRINGVRTNPMSYLK